MEGPLDDKHRPRYPPQRGFGIDFWHAVEFSRSGRSPVKTLAGPSSGQPFKLTQSQFLRQPALIFRTSVGGPATKKNSTPSYGQSEPQHSEAEGAGSVGGLHR